MVNIPTFNHTGNAGRGKNLKITYFFYHIGPEQPFSNAHLSKFSIKNAVVDFPKFFHEGIQRKKIPKHELRDPLFEDVLGIDFCYLVTRTLCILPVVRLRKK